MTEIGEELSVENIVEGSVRRVGDKVRIVVQLIDAKTDLHLWSETYDRDLKDVLALQSEIAIEIANALEARLTSTEKQNITKMMSKDVTAYDYFLKAREIANKGVLLLEIKDFEDALSLINRSLQLDPDFAQAMALKGVLWFDGSYIGIENSIWQDSALHYATKAIKTDPASPDGYLLRASILRFIGQSNDGKSDYHKAYELAPNNPEILYPYGWQLLREGNEQGADMIIQSITSQYKTQDPEYYTSLSDIYYFLGDDVAREDAFKKAKSLDPGSAGPVLGLSGLYWETGQYDKGIAEVEKFHSIERWGIDRLGWLYFLKKDYKNAIKYWGKYKEIEAGFIGKTQTVPFRHRLGMAYAKLGNKAKADSLFQEHLQINLAMISGARSIGTWDGLGGAYYDKAACLAYFGKEKEALQSLDSAWLYGFNWNWGYHNDPVMDNIRNTDQFKALIKSIDDGNAFRKRAFSNAYNRAKASDELKNILK